MLACSAECKGGHGKRATCKAQEGGGLWVAQGSVWVPSSWRIGQVRSRTANIWYMLVTLEVSKVSGWLNAVAPYRVQREAC